MSNTSPRATLASRLARQLATTAAIAASPLVIAESASAQIVYRTYNLAIPATFDGLYVNVETGVTGPNGGATPGWDLNPYGTATNAISMFWSGTAGGPSAGVRLNLASGANGSTCSRLPADFSIGAQLTGGASGASFGSGAVTFATTTPGFWSYNAANIFGFRFTGADGQLRYGWARIQVGANAATRTLVDIAYESTPLTAIAAGNQGGPPPDYNPCATNNPQFALGANNLSLNQTTSTTLNVTTPCGFQIFKANYFKYTAPIAGVYTFSTTGSGADTRMAIMNDCQSSAIAIACNDDAGGTLGSQCSVELPAGSSVYCVIGSAVEGTNLPSPIAATLVAPPTPDCSTAVAVQFGNNDFSNSGQTADLVVKTSNTGGTAVIYDAKWHLFTPAVTGAYSFSVCGSNNDTKMALAAACPTFGTIFNSIAYNDDQCACGTGCGTTTQNDWASRLDATNAGLPLTTELVAGQSYYLLVGSYSTTSGTVTGNLTIDGPPQPPANPADLNGDGVVDALDLADLLAAWGSTSGVADINQDGIVDALDLAEVLSGWTF